MQNSTGELMFISVAAIIFGIGVWGLNKMGVFNFGRDWFGFLSGLQRSNQSY